MTGKAPPSSPTHWIKEQTIAIWNTLTFFLCSFCFLLECIPWSEDTRSEAVAVTLWLWGNNMERAWIPETVTGQLQPSWTAHFQTLIQINDQYSLLYFKASIAQPFFSVITFIGHNNICPACGEHGGDCWHLRWIALDFFRFGCPKSPSPPWRPRR